MSKKVPSLFVARSIGPLFFGIVTKNEKAMSDPSLDDIRLVASPRGVVYLISTRSKVFVGGVFKSVLDAANRSLPEEDRLEKSNLFKVMRGARRYNQHKGCTAARVPVEGVLEHPLFAQARPENVVLVSAYATRSCSHGVSPR